MASPQQLAQMSPPYPPETWSLGGRLKESTDIPVSAVFLVLFAIGAAGHMTVFQKNKRRGHKFVLSILMFGFCMCRVVTMTLRIASSTRPNNIRLSIAAGIFVAAGVLLVYVVNLLFAQRLIRSRHPKLGWSKPFRAFFIANYVLIVLSLIMVITVTVQSFYTLSDNTHRIDRDVQLYCATYFSLVSFFPIPLVLLSFGLPRRTPLEKFGSGRYRTKVIVLISAAFLLCLGACYRCGTEYLPTVSLREPLPAYFSKACFYIFDFTIEIIVVMLYLIVRIDQRFHVPNGSSKRCSYIIEDPLKDGKAYHKASSLAGSTTTSNTEFPRMLTGETVETLPLKEDKKGILKVNTKFSEKQRQADLEAQMYEPHSAMTGTTAAALSKDHLPMPEAPERAHHPLRDPPRSNSVPPVPQIPEKLKRERETPTPEQSRSHGDNDKLDKVVDLLVSLDHRLSTLEDTKPRPPSTFDLLDRLDRRLSTLSTAPPADGFASPAPGYGNYGMGTGMMSGLASPAAASGYGSPAPRPQSGFDLLERLDRRLSRLEEHEQAQHQQQRAMTPSGLDNLIAIDRRLSRIEAFNGSGSGYPEEQYNNAPRGRMSMSRYSHMDPAAGPGMGMGMGMSMGGAGSPLHPPPDSRFDRYDLGGHSPHRGRGASPRGSPDRFGPPIASPSLGQGRMTQTGPAQRHSYFPPTAAAVPEEAEREDEEERERERERERDRDRTPVAGASNQNQNQIQNQNQNPGRGRHVSWRASTATVMGSGAGSRVDLSSGAQQGHERHRSDGEADDEGVGEGEGLSSPSSGEFHSA